MLAMDDRGAQSGGRPTPDTQKTQIKGMQSQT